MTAQQQQPGSAWIEYTFIVCQGNLMLYDTREWQNCYNIIPFDDDVMIFRKQSCYVKEGSFLYQKVTLCNKKNLFCKRISFSVQASFVMYKRFAGALVNERVKENHYFFWPKSPSLFNKHLHRGDRHQPNRRAVP